MAWSGDDGICWSPVIRNTAVPASAVRSVSSSILRASSGTVGVAFVAKVL